MYTEFSIREHETDNAIEVLVHVRSMLCCQLSTGEIVCLQNKKLLEENLPLASFGL